MQTERQVKIMENKVIIEMLEILISDSYACNPVIARNFTIIKDCKKENFDFVISEAIKALKAGDNT